MDILAMAPILTTRAMRCTRQLRTSGGSLLLSACRLNPMVGYADHDSDREKGQDKACIVWQGKMWRRRGFSIGCTPRFHPRARPLSRTRCLTTESSPRW